MLLEPVREAVEQPEPADGGNGTDGAVPPSTDAGTDAARDAGQEPDADGSGDMDAGLDPDVRFEWAETLPGQGMCSPARYVGSFTCTVQQAPGPAVVGGQIRFDLEGAAEGQLSIENGVVSDLTGVLFSGVLEGSLDCVTNTFEAVTNGGRAIIGVLLPFRSFDARLDGTFDKQSLEINGDFFMTNDANESCLGMFQAVVAP